MSKCMKLIGKKVHCLFCNLGSKPVHCSAKDRPTLGEFTASLLLNGSDACLATGYGLLKQCTLLMDQEVRDYCSADLSATDLIQPKHRAGQYDRFQVQQMLQSMALTGFERDEIRLDWQSVQELCFFGELGGTFRLFQPVPPTQGYRWPSLQTAKH